jgi:hypothetical protein
MCELGHHLADVRARQDAQLLAAHYNQIADALERACPIHPSQVTQMPALTDATETKCGGGCWN